MELVKEKSEKNIIMDTNGSIADRIHLFSDMHGSLAEDYVPEWKRNVAYRNENIKLAKQYGVTWSTHGDTAYLG